MHIRSFFLVVVLIFFVSGCSKSSDTNQSSGNKSTEPDNTAPTIGTGITFTSVMAVGPTVQWGSASDNVTTSNSLQYKLVKDDVATTNLDTISAADAKTGGDLLMDWTANTTSFAVTGLASSTTYHFAVLVRDSSGNKAIYTPASQMTAEGTAPTIGAAISFSGLFSTMVTVNWGAGSDNVTAVANLQYKLVKDNTSTANINSIAAADAKTGGDLLMDWSTNTLNYSVTGLSNGNTYHFAVLVRDAAGNKALYSPNSVTTAPGWIQQAYLKAANAGAGDQFGFSVAISGDTAVVGANGEASNQTTVTNGSTASSDNSAAFAGAAYVFVRNGSNWTQQAYLKAPNAEANDNFGYSTAIDGDTIVVGARLDDSNQTTITNGSTASADNSAANAGSAYVFVRNAGTWSMQAYLKAANADGNDMFGTAVSISGDTIVVSAPFEASNQTSITNGATASSDNSSTNTGAAYVFVRSGGTWSQQAYLKAPNANSGDYFGGTVASDGTGPAIGISGDTIVVGAWRESSNQTTITNGTTASSDNSATFSGAAYVFVRTAGNWAQEAYLKPSNAQANDYFGMAVAISGDTVVVGAGREDSNQATVTNGATASSDNSLLDPGAAYVFVRTGSLWAQQAYLKAPNVAATDYFGEAVAISGDTIVIGARQEDSNQITVTNGATASADNSASSAGASYVFVRTAGNWSQQAYLKAANAGFQDEFGNNVAISGNSIIVGAKNEDSNQVIITNGATASSDNSASNAGAAYIFIRQ